MAYSSYTVTSMTVLPGASYDEYSYVDVSGVSGLSGLALSGGWATVNDVGPDILYETQAGSMLNPTPIVWTNPSVAAQYHDNDPTAVAPTSDSTTDRAGWDYMYFTSLPNSAATTSPTQSNEISLATTTDGGAHWTDLGPIITNGWSPSALQLGSEIDVFYHTNATPMSQAMMVRLSENGWQELAAPVALIDTATNAPLEAVNVSVAQSGNTLYLVGNGFGGGAQFGDIVAFTASASDPTHWTPLLSTGPVLIHGGSVDLLTPEIKITGANTATIWFTENSALTAAQAPTGLPQTTNTMEWTLALHA